MASLSTLIQHYFLLSFLLKFSISYSFGKQLNEKVDEWDRNIVCKRTLASLLVFPVLLLQLIKTLKNVIYFEF